jgi:hypothetical protein
MIELENHGIALATVDAPMCAQVLEDEVLRLTDALGLEGVVAAAVMSTPFGVVGLEAVAAPPLATGSEPVEAALRPLA